MLRESKFSCWQISFSNPQNLDLLQVDLLIRSKLIDSTWFYAHQWQVPDLHRRSWDNELDHTFHEFESIELTDDAATHTLPF